jgi:eukaryotic-like serine/threonine-protein kinase
LHIGLGQPERVRDCLAPNYVQAEREASAAVEFQKILGHRGIVLWTNPSAYRLISNSAAPMPSWVTVKARATYQEFLTLWKDADPDIPVLKQAKAEYAKKQ